jgi:hypothetical protein
VQKYKVEGRSSVLRVREDPLFTFVVPWRFAKAALLCAVSLLWLSPAHALGIEARFSPLGYRDHGNQVPVQDTPQQVCDVWAAWWGWDQSPFSYRLTDDLPGRWKCQRYHEGSAEPGQYTYVRGVCQRRPEPLATGSDWSYPTYDSNFAAACACREGKVFDWSVEWCTAAPSCRTYPDNKVTECGKTVEELVNLKKDRSDPTRYFHETQTCIARSSCNLRCKMEHCDWLKEVIPAFVDPYLRKSGGWPAVEARCRRRPQTWPNQWRCAEEMARHHILFDLLPAVVRYGCGSESDWALVFNEITACSQKVLEVNGTWARVIVAPIYGYREIVRAACVMSRVSAGLPSDINEDIKGKVCTP